MDSTAPDLTVFLAQNGPTLWWTIYAVTLVLYSVFSAVLVYHWNTYAIGAPMITQTFWWYFSSTGVLWTVITIASVIGTS
jgi:hypothetical protein